jgi:tRNA threonylcarbamoyladenosine biosynthesis protein TsaB
MVHPNINAEPRRKDAILAIDTSTEHAGLALGTLDGVLVRSWPAGRTQTTSVLPVIDDLLHEVGLAPSNLSAVAVATGPGTFTGLRVGMSIAKGIVLALGVPIVGIPTLCITAAGVPDADDLIAILPAGRGRVVWQRFGPEGDASPHNSTLDELIQHLESLPDVLVAGELSEVHQGRIEQAHGRVQWEHRDSAVLLRLASERLGQGDADDPVTLEPIYLHGVVVQSGPVQDRLKRKP